MKFPTALAIFQPIIHGTAIGLGAALSAKVFSVAVPGYPDSSVGVGVAVGTLAVTYFSIKWTNAALARLDPPTFPGAADSAVRSYASTTNRIRVAVTRKGGMWMDYLDFDTDQPLQVYMIAETLALRADGHLRVRDWVGKQRGKPFSKKEFDRFCDRLVELELVRTPITDGKYILNFEGKKVFRAIAARRRAGAHAKII